MATHHWLWSLWLATASLAAHGAGYEKSIPWGGRSAGVAGIATPYVQGSQSLFFNPAGLATAPGSQDISLNASPTWSRFSGPINNANDIVTSESRVRVPFGLTYGRAINDKIGVGIGTYLSAGSFADYEDVAFSSGDTHVKTEFSVAELALGIGYKLNDKWKLGAAWRGSLIRGGFAFVSRGAALANVEVNDAKDSNFTGYKLGAQFKANENWLFGFTYRSEVDVEAKGKFGGRVHGVGAIDENDVTAKTTFPRAATLGAQYRLTDTWKLLGEYAWTQYSRVKAIKLNGTLSRNGGALIANDPELLQKWKDQHNVRLAGEYTGWDLPVRMGYVWTSRVTNPHFARATFTPPGPAHTVTVGTGRTWGETWDIQGALEYTFVSGSADGGAPAGTGGTGTDIRAGDYDVRAVAAHLGVSYFF